MNVLVICIKIFMKKIFGKKIEKDLTLKKFS